MVENGRAYGVEFQNGERLLSNVIVSNAGFNNTFYHLLDAENQRCFDTKEKVLQVGHSTAHVCLYVGLDASDAELALPKHNLWIYKNYNFAEAIRDFSFAGDSEIPLVYISFPSAKDPQREQNNGGRATVQVIAAYDFEQVERWCDRAWRKRGEDYERAKEEIKNKLTDALVKALPQLKGRIAYTELSTPLSTRHFMNYQHGEIYGLEHTPARFKLRSLRPQTRIKGLFLTGQDVVTVGVGGALYSGVLTSTAILKKSMILRILFKRRTLSPMSH